MIEAILFDLDGTLVQTEKLKAQSYAVAVQRIRGLPEPDDRAIEAYREIVGASRDVASRHVMNRLDLEADLRPLVAERGVSEPWEALAAMRKEIYDGMVADPQVIRDNQWPHTVGLLRIAKDSFCHTGLVTMSYRPEALHVLRALELEETLDVIVAREDVEKAKPDPEAYLLAARLLDVEPGACLVLEDSPNGARSGVAAGMAVVAVATPFTQAGLHESQVVDECSIVHSPDELIEVVSRRILEQNRSAG
ncbi:MAG: HAD family hydrolase [Chloroflexi bacterium]|nr:HAD family hydrolase [Chloroflexota bacterium]